MNTSKIMALGFIFSSVVFLGCSPLKFQSAKLQAPVAANETSLASTATVPVVTDPAAAIDTFSVTDASSGDGRIVVRINQNINGAGPSLRACTGPISAINRGCLVDSDFSMLTDNWGLNSYNAEKDAYVFNRDVSADGYPFQEYFTRLILADGSRRIFKFKPALVVAASVLKWVYTNPQACVGPTPAAAPIGQSCAVLNEARTNACGTVTCLMVRQ